MVDCIFFNTSAFWYDIPSAFSALQVDALVVGVRAGVCKEIFTEQCITVVKIKLYDIWLLQRLDNFLVCNWRLSTVFSCFISC